MAAERVRAHVRVRGRVQGVWFRQSAADRAAVHGVAGWIRNVDDGSVEAVFEGPRDAVDAAIGFVRLGPPRARVEGVDVVWEEPRGETRFAVR